MGIHPLWLTFRSREKLSPRRTLSSEAYAEIRMVDDAHKTPARPIATVRKTSAERRKRIGLPVAIPAKSNVRNSAAGIVR